MRMQATGNYYGTITIPKIECDDTVSPVTQAVTVQESSSLCTCEELGTTDWLSGWL